MRQGPTDDPHTHTYIHPNAFRGMGAGRSELLQLPPTPLRPLLLPLPPTPLPLSPPTGRRCEHHTQQTNDMGPEIRTSQREARLK